MNKDLFKIATKEKYRFSYKGESLSVEELWDLNIDGLYDVYNNTIQEINDLIQKFTPRSKDVYDATINKLSIVSEIIDNKSEEYIKVLPMYQDYSDWLRDIGCMDNDDSIPPFDNEQYLKNKKAFMEAITKLKDEGDK